jgi:hypothetical protein
VSWVGFCPPLGGSGRVEMNEEGIGWVEFLRVRIKVDLSKLLARGRKLKLLGDLVWIAFQFERLPRFCFHCGVISHGMLGSVKRQGTRSSSFDLEYGP